MTRKPNEAWSRQPHEKLQCLYENLVSINFGKTAVLKKKNMNCKLKLKQRILLTNFWGSIFHFFPGHFSSHRTIYRQMYRKLLRVPARRGLSRRGKNERKERDLYQLLTHACACVSLTTSDVFVACDTTHRTGLRAKLQQMSRTPQSCKFEESEDVR